MAPRRVHVHYPSWMVGWLIWIAGIESLSSTMTMFVLPQFGCALSMHADSFGEIEFVTKLTVRICKIHFLRLLTKVLFESVQCAALPMLSLHVCGPLYGQPLEICEYDIDQSKECG